MSKQPLKLLLAKHSSLFASVLAVDFEKLGAQIDLSKENSELLETYGAETEGFFSIFIKKYLQLHQLAAVAGGYHEERSVYQRGENFYDQQEPRTFHLGVDVWQDAGTAIYAPLQSTIHSLQNNDHLGDYGPTIILAHELEGQKFHTLYGHLSLESLTGKQPGMVIEKGAQFATFGDHPINGGWYPHLHFQVIDDMQGFTGDYPGVSAKSKLEFYAENCPNPNLILGYSQLG